MEGFCRVAVDSPVLALDRPFDYAIPERMLGRVRVGSVVRIPLHGRRMRGFVTELIAAPAVAAPKPLSALVSEEPLFDVAGIELARWTASRYVASVGSVLHLAVPGRYSAPAGGARPPADTPATPAPAWLPSSDGLSASLERGGAVVVCPTASEEPGLTAYLAGLAARRHRQMLVIAPRVSVAERIAEQIPGAALLHSDLRPAARARAWAAARDSAAPVLVGGRAALFVPMPDLGLVVVASAHDRSLKEERSPRLHALRVARRRAGATGAAFVAVSPAPPLELLGREGFDLLEPVQRSRGPVRPEVGAPRPGPVTSRLVDAVRWATERGRDALVFAGRRGFALRVRCDDCGWFPRCPACGTGLTLFGSGTSATLRCRGCGATAQVPGRCPDCRGADLHGRGWGTERIADALGGIDLGAPVLRVEGGSPLPEDRPRPAVVVGTQAGAWALEGAAPAAVVVADVDQLLGLPDFRAGEHALQLLHDLAGILEPGGRFLLQTREPEHHVVQAFTRRSYRFFTERELPFRRSAGYPPFGAVVLVDGPPDAVADLRGLVGGAGEVIGPLPRPQGRQAALVRADATQSLLEPLRKLAERHPAARIDVDPVDVL